MAITPRTILTSAAPATVAVVSLYFFTVLGTTAFTALHDSDSADDVDVDEPTAQSVLERTTVCDHVAIRFQGDPSTWSEFAWSRFVDCLDDHDRSEEVIDFARAGLQQYPRSEYLYNLKGYHQSVLGDHAGAIDTLERGMDSVTHHRNGVMANNLAWAGMWEPRKIETEKARELYVQALALSPDSCEIVHTGLFVEFAMTNQADDGLARYESLTRFNELRNRYNQCLDRLADADRKTVVEILGAAVLFSDVDGLDDGEVHPLMRSTTSKFFADHDDTSVDALCEEAMPLADYHHDCVDAVETSLRAQRELNREHEIRDARVDEIRGEFIEHHGDDHPALHDNDSSEGSPTSDCGGGAVIIR